MIGILILLVILLVIAIKEALNEGYLQFLYFLSKKYVGRQVGKIHVEDDWVKFTGKPLYKFYLVDVKNCVNQINIFREEGKMVGDCLAVRWDGFKDNFSVIIRHDFVQIGCTRLNNKEFNRISNYLTKQ